MEGSKESIGSDSGGLRLSQGRKEINMQRMVQMVQDA